MSQGSKICRKCHGTLEAVLKLGRRVHRGGQNTAVIDCPDCGLHDQIHFMEKEGLIEIKTDIACVDCSGRGTRHVMMGGVCTEIECPCQFPSAFQVMPDRPAQLNETAR